MEIDFQSMGWWLFAYYAGSRLAAIKHWWQWLQKGKIVDSPLLKLVCYLTPGLELLYLAAGINFLLSCLGRTIAWLFEQDQKLIDKYSKPSKKE